MVLKTLGNYVLVRIGVQLYVVETQNNASLNKIEIYFSLTPELLSSTISQQRHEVLIPASRKRERERTLLPSEPYDLEVSYVTVAYLSWPRT